MLIHKSYMIRIQYQIRNSLCNQIKIRKQKVENMVRKQYWDKDFLIKHKLEILEMSPLLIPLQTKILVNLVLLKISLMKVIKALHFILLI